MHLLTIRFALLRPKAWSIWHYHGQRIYLQVATYLSAKHKRTGHQSNWPSICYQLPQGHFWPTFNGHGRSLYWIRWIFPRAWWSCLWSRIWGNHHRAKSLPSWRYDRDHGMSCSIRSHYSSPIVWWIDHSKMIRDSFPWDSSLRSLQGL